MKTLDIRVAFGAIDRFTRPVNAARKSASGLTESLKNTQAAASKLNAQADTFNRLRNSINKTSQQIDKTRRSLSGLNQAQRDGTVLTDAQRERMSALAAKLDRLSAARTRETQKLRTVSDALRQHGINLAGGNRTIESAIRRTEQYNQTLERERRQLAAVTQARARYDRLQTLSDKLRGAGTMAMAGGAAAGYAAGRFLAPAVGFGAEMSRVQALTRLDKNDDQLSALRQQAKKLGAETAFTTTDAASGQAFLAMAGFTPQAIRAALPGVLNMALAGGMELGESADIGSNVLSQFSLPAGQMDRVSDVLTAAFTRTNTDLRQLGETMVYAGPVMSKLGIDVEKAAAMAGILANNGMRGSMAGTAMRASLARLASPTKKAKTALDELGVSVADASGKMRPVESILLDLFNATKKYGETDQVSFFKDIAGEEAFVGLQSLAQGAGSGALQKLIAELGNAKGEANKAAKVMADNLSGDLKELDSAWEGLRIAVEETADGALRKLSQGLTSILNGVTGWANANPQLTKTLLLLTAGIIGTTVAAGGLSLTLGILAGPFAKLQLGLSMLTMRASGASKILGVFSGPLARISGWGRVFSTVLGSVSGGLRSMTALLPAMRAGLLGAFMAPGAAIGSLVRGIGMFALRLSGLPMLWSAITTGISILGGALSLLLSPIGLLVGAFVLAGVMIWKYWEPIKAFFTGFLGGLVSSMAPAFAPFVTLFGQIADGIGRVWNWFTRLLSPVQTSQTSLDKCAGAGRRFGEVLGSALATLMTPLTWLADAVSSLLEKLGMVPDAINTASSQMDALLNKANNLRNTLPMQAATVVPDAKPAPAMSGTMRRLSAIEDNTKQTAANTKKIGPGDIVFKNLPPALAVRGQWQESRIARSAAGSPLSMRPAAPVVSSPVRLPALPSPAAAATSARQAAAVPAGALPPVVINLHGVDRQDAQELAKIVKQAVSAELDRRAQRARGSYKDRE
ncbi:phage tail tape measure protein [Pantoea agglomerans]|uniref:phage tail tape measure protein n=1 Tax=Enterobacter agglomerans TaxID=549 RepID=UPI003BF53A52